MILKIFQVVQKLEANPVLNVPSEIVVEVADAVETTKKMGIQVDWIYKILREINTKRDHYAMVWESQSLRNRIAETNRGYQVSLGAD